jgi:hypothetical protein
MAAKSSALFFADADMKAPFRSFLPTCEAIWHRYHTSPKKFPAGCQEKFRLTLFKIAATNLGVNREFTICG